MYAIALHQPWASVIALGIKTVETRSWPAPARLMGQTVVVHAGKRAVRKPCGPIERESVRLGEDWNRTIPADAALAHNVLKMVQGDLLSGVPSAGLLVSSDTRPFPFRNGRPEEQ